MFRFFFLFLLVCGSLFCADEIKEKEFWIDVRTLEEFQSGHLKEALHIPYQEIAKKIKAVTKDKKAKIHVYCKVGGRAGIAKKALESLGYVNVVNSGGYEAILSKRKLAMPKN